MKRVHVIDSHTGGEPTRLVMSGFPDLSGNSMVEKRDALRSSTTNGAAPVCSSRVATMCWSARCIARRCRLMPPAG